MQYFLLFILPVYFWSALYLYDEYGGDMAPKMNEFKNNINLKTGFNYDDFDFNNAKCYMTNGTNITISKTAILNDGYHYFKLLFDTDVMVM